MYVILTTMFIIYESLQKHFVTIAILFIIQMDHLGNKAEKIELNGINFIVFHPAFTMIYDLNYW